MKQRVEDLERQVDTFRQQAQQAGAQPASEDTSGGGSGGNGGKPVPSKESGPAQVSGGAATAQGEERPKTITVNTNLAATRGRKRMKQVDIDSNNAETSVRRRGSNDRPEPPETRNGGTTGAAGHTAGIATPPSGSYIARRASSNLVARAGQDQTSVSPQQPQQHQTQDGDADPAHAQHPQDLEPLLTDELPQGPAQPLLSPSNSSNAYLHPGLLSPPPQGINGAAPFAPPYFSPNIPTLAMSQSPFSGYPMVPMNAQGQYPGPGQEWPWQLQWAGHDGRRMPYGQQGLMPGEWSITSVSLLSFCACSISFVFVVFQMTDPKINRPLWQQHDPGTASATCCCCR